MTEPLDDALAAAQSLVSGVTAATPDEAVAAAATRLVTTYPRYGALLLWSANRRGDHPHPALSRAISFGLVREAQGTAHWLPQLIDLTVPPFTSDASTLINTISAISRALESCEQAVQAIAPGLTRFIDHCLSSHELVQDAAIGLLAEVLGHHADLLSIHQARIIKEVLAPLERDASDPHQKTLDFVRDRLPHSKARLSNSDVSFLSSVSQRLRNLARDALLATATSVLNDAAEFLETRTLLVETAGAARAHGLPVHFIRIAAHSASALSLSSLGAITEAWQKLLSSAVKGSQEFFPVGAATGSIVLRIAVKGDAPVNMFGALEKLLGATESTELVDALREAEVSACEYRSLVEPLAESGASLTVGAFDATTDSFLETRHYDAAGVASKAGLVRALTSATLLSSDVPQADELQRVFSLVEILAKTGSVTPEALGVTQRQVSYYKHAAKVLGLLAEFDRLTPSGELLPKLSGEQRLAVTCVKFESSRCGAEWIRWAGKATLLEVPPESAESFLAEAVVDLSEATVKRRAATLMRWHGDMVPHHYAIPRV